MEITTGTKLSFLKDGKAGHALTGTAVGPVTTSKWVLIKITSYESKRDKNNVGDVFSVPVEDVVPA